MGFPECQCFCSPDLCWKVIPKGPIGKGTKASSLQPNLFLRISCVLGELEFNHLTLSWRYLDRLSHFFYSQ